MIALTLIAALLPTPSAKVREVRYPYLALQADVICVGTVESVVSLGDQPRVITLESGVEATVQPFVAARLRVEEVWKGSPELRELWFVGSSSWVCDTTSARVGDHLLLLLDRWTDTRLEKNAWRAELREILHGQPFHSIEWAGRGELRIVERKEKHGEVQPTVALGGLLPMEDRKDEDLWRSLAEMHELTRSILAENELGTVLDPTSGGPASAAILRQELAADGTTRTSVVMAVFDREPHEVALWSAAASGSGPPWRCGVLQGHFAPLWNTERSASRQAWLVPHGALVACGSTRELIVLRDPLACCTRAEPAKDQDDADARAWRDFRAYIAGLQPSEGQDAPGVTLAIGR